MRVLCINGLPAGDIDLASMDTGLMDLARDSDILPMREMIVCKAIARTGGAAREAAIGRDLALDLDGGRDGPSGLWVRATSAG